MITLLITLALTPVAYAVLVLVIAFTGPHNETEKRELRERRREG